MWKNKAVIEVAIERYTAMGVEDPLAEALKKAPEGIPLEVKVKGSVRTVIHNLLGGVRSGISRRGVLSITDFQKQNPLDPETGFIILDRKAQEESYKRGGMQ